MTATKKTAKSSRRAKISTEEKILEQSALTALKTPVDPAHIANLENKVVDLRGESLERDILRKAIVDDLMSIEGFDKKAENARLKMLLDAIALCELGGLNLRVENIGVLRTKMLSQKGGWCETSFAPSLSLVWKGKAMTASRKNIMRQCSVVLHWVVKDKIGVKINSRYDNGNGGFFVNTATNDDGTPQNPGTPEDLIKKAKGAPVLVMTFNELLGYANAALAEEGAPQASAIETAAQKLVDALNEKSAEDVPADAWNNLSIVAGRISTLFRERDKLQKETPTGKKRIEASK
jgi:hypothetical protein